MRYKTDIDKSYLNSIVDCLEDDLNAATMNNFDRRSSVTKRGGRPYAYSPKEIGDQMVIYFRDCIENERPFMVTGLCMDIGISREWLRKLEKSSKDEFVDTIKKGKHLIEYYLEIQTHLLPNPSFPIFVLKNMGWKEK